jgi:hypothetical protein
LQFSGASERVLLLDSTNRRNLDRERNRLRKIFRWELLHLHVSASCEDRALLLSNFDKTQAAPFDFIVIDIETFLVGHIHS